jgi:hypothetical protein
LKIETPAGVLPLIRHYVERKMENFQGAAIRALERVPHAEGRPTEQ